MTVPNKHFVTVDAVILSEDADEDKTILLIQRANPPFQGMWALPGGFVDVNECVEDACKREAKEETGFDVYVDPMPIGVYSKLGRDPRGYIISIVYQCPIIGGEMKAGDDAKKAEWFRLKDLPDMAFDHKKIIEDYFGPQ